jgi:NCS1 family nucleobase:cation symporter-1
MVAFSAIGVIITSASVTILHGVDASKLWDPVYLLSQLTSPLPPPGQAAPLIASAATRWAVAIISLFGVGVATLSVNIAANVVSPANDFANLSPKHISFRTGGLITGLLGIAIMPWKLLSSAETYIFSWLVGYSALLGPIAGVMIADYWVLRRQQLDVPDLYRTAGRYAGVNPIAVGALALGVLPNLPGFLSSAKLVSGVPAFFDELYPYAWFVGFFLAFFAQLGGTLLLRRKAAPVSGLNGGAPG